MDHDNQAYNLLDDLSIEDELGFILNTENLPELGNTDILDFFKEIEPAELGNTDILDFFKEIEPLEYNSLAFNTIPLNISNNQTSINNPGNSSNFNLSLKHFDHFNTKTDNKKPSPIIINKRKAVNDDLPILTILPDINNDKMFFVEKKQKVDNSINPNRTCTKVSVQEAPPFRKINPPQTSLGPFYRTKESSLITGTPSFLSQDKPVLPHLPDLEVANKYEQKSCNIKIELQYKKFNKRLSCSQHVYIISCNHNHTDFFKQLTDFLEIFLNKYKYKIVYVTINLKNNYFITLRTDKQGQIDYETLFSRLSNVSQSGSKAEFNKSEISIFCIDPPSGDKPSSTLQQHIKNIETSYLSVGNSKFGCFWKALSFLFLKKTEAKKQKGKSFFYITNWLLDQIEKKSYELAKECHLAYDKKIDYNDIKSVSEILKIRIVVYILDDAGNISCYIRRSQLNDIADLKIFYVLLLYNNTYYAIKPNMLNELMKNKGPKRRFCNFCLDFYRENGLIHYKNCTSLCSQCLDFKCHTEINNNIICNKCKRHFKNEQCVKNHNANNTCDTIYICKCGCLINSLKKKTHNCFERYCDICKTKYKPNNKPHYCYFSVPTIKKELARVIYFDFETYTDSENNHVPCLAVIQVICDLCKHNYVSPLPDLTLQACKVCKKHQVIFENNNEQNCVRLLLDYILDLAKNNNKFETDQLDKKNKKIKRSVFTYLIAHNLSYDASFLLFELLNTYDHIFLDKNLMLKGNKIINIKLEYNISIIDSYQFLHTSLKKLPAIFGFESVMSKGYFPYNFLNFENYNYIGAIPAKSYFELDNLSSKELTDFNSWYKSFSNKDYNIRQELVNYCIQDVKILLLCFETFRTTIIQDQNIDLVQNCYTIASLCFTIYRKNFMKVQIPVINRKEVPTTGFSYKAIHWLSAESIIRKEKIVHARSFSGEVKVFTEDSYYKIDGVSYHENGAIKNLYEFFGCYYHSCMINDCPYNKGQTFFGKSRIDNFNETVEKIKKLEKTYNLITIWECQFEKRMKTDPAFAELIKKSRTAFSIQSLEPGKALYGGRTEAFLLKKECATDDVITYKDITSLYPSQQFYKKMPVGIPEVYIGLNLPSIEDFTNQLKDPDNFGIVFCNVLPPNDLKIPVLPTRIEKKLYFTLCSKCAIEQNQYDCKHNDKERSITGSYTFHELALSIEKKYKLVKIYEIWKFNDNRKIFKDYIKYFYSMKVKASGLPSELTSDNEKNSYINYLKNELEIDVSIEDINLNPGLRMISKLCLNSLWGRFGLNHDRVNTVICDDLAKLLEIIDDVSNDIKAINLCGDKVIIQYKPASIQNIKGSNINTVIASYVTSFARIALYNLIDKVNPDNLLYCDTDSLICIEKKNQITKLKCDFKLGGLKNEITSDYGLGSEAIKFVCLGPKSYLLQIKLPNNTITSQIKLKGIYLKPNDKKVDLEYEDFLELLSDKGQEMRIPQTNFKQVKWGGVTTTKTLKLLRNTHTKRRVLDNTFFKTVPYGFKM